MRIGKHMSDNAIENMLNNLSELGLTYQAYQIVMAMRLPSDCCHIPSPPIPSPALLCIVVASYV